RYGKALGLEVNGQAQVSMNLVDTERTPVHRAYDMVRREAAAAGVNTTWSEIVGLIPERALFDAAARYLQLAHFSPGQVFERKLRAALPREQTVAAFVASLASSSPTPGGGSAAAQAGTLAAALAQMVAGLTIGKKQYAGVRDEMDTVAQRAAQLVQRLSQLVELDAESYAAVSAAYKLPKGTPEQITQRDAAITAALIGASEVPLETARACAEVAALSEVVATKGNRNAVYDAGVSALLAEAACRGAVYNVRINVASLDDKSRGAGLLEEANQLIVQTSARAKAVIDAV